MRSALARGLAAGALGAGVLVGSPAAAATVAGGLPSMAGLEDYDWWFEAMRIKQAHGQGATGKGVQVALIDSALDLRAAELRGQDIGLRTNCDGGRAQPMSERDYAVGAEADHGTSMASLIVGSGRGNGPQGAGVTGVAPRARLLAYEAGRSGYPCRGDVVADLVDEAVADGADVISVSLILDDGVVPAVRRALQAGAVVVGGMPNEQDQAGRSRFPAGLPGVVAVQGVDRDADPAEWTIPHESAVIAAPGVEIGSVRWNPSAGRLDSTSWSSGTSPATAIVSGVLAAVKSKYPEATGNQLVQHLIHHTGGEDDFDWDPAYGFGITSVTEMLKSSPTQWPDENPLASGPERATKDYPPWVSSEVEDPPGKGENAPSADAGATDAGDESDGTDQAANADEGAGGADEDNATPRWAWPVAAGLVVLAAVGIVVARRRGGGAA